MHFRVAVFVEDGAENRVLGSELVEMVLHFEIGEF
jgi:hypothetical protein